MGFVFGVKLIQFKQDRLRPGSRFLQGLAAVLSE